jgi:hypothetical protein
MWNWLRPPSLSVCLSLSVWILCSASCSCLITVCRTADGWRLRLLPLFLFSYLSISFAFYTPPPRTVRILDVSILGPVFFSCFSCIHLNPIESIMAAVSLRLKKHKSCVGLYLSEATWNVGCRASVCVLGSWSPNKSVGQAVRPLICHSVNQPHIRY